MSHANISVRDFINDISKGNYVIPHFQRDFNWQPNMVSDLFKSIINDYYAGTILLWSLDDKDRDLKMWDPLWGTNKSEKPTKAILDGQQRLSSIYYSLYAPERTFPNRTTYYHFFVNLDQTFLGNEDESIIYKYYKNYKSIESFKNERDNLINDGLFPICLLSDEQFINSQEYQDWLNEYVKSREGTNDLQLTALSVSKRIERLLSYTFLTETLEQKGIKEICTIFANINSKGLRLDIFDLMNAFLYPKGIHLRKDWENVDNTILKDVDTQMKVYI